MWHLTACKISVSLSFLNWIKNEMIFFYYRISELMLATLIQRYKIISFNLNFIGCQVPHFMIVLTPYINLLNFSWIQMSIREEYEAFKAESYKHFRLFFLFSLNEWTRFETPSEFFSWVYVIFYNKDTQRAYDVLYNVASTSTEVQRCINIMFVYTSTWRHCQAWSVFVSLPEQLKVFSRNVRKHYSDNSPTPQTYTHTHTQRFRFAQFGQNFHWAHGRQPRIQRFSLRTTNSDPISRFFYIILILLFCCCFCIPFSC